MWIPAFSRLSLGATLTADTQHSLVSGRPTAWNHHVLFELCVGPTIASASSRAAHGGSHPSVARNRFRSHGDEVVRSSALLSQPDSAEMLRKRLSRSIVACKYKLNNRQHEVLGVTGLFDGKRNADGHPAVFLFAQLLAVLPRDSTRMTTLLGEPSVIHDPGCQLYVLRSMNRYRPNLSRQSVRPQAYLDDAGCRACRSRCIKKRLIQGRAKGDPLDI